MITQDEMRDLAFDAYNNGDLDKIKKLVEIGFDVNYQVECYEKRKYDSRPIMFYEGLMMGYIAERNNEIRGIQNRVDEIKPIIEYLLSVGLNKVKISTLNPDAYLNYANELDIEIELVE